MGCIKAIPVFIYFKPLHRQWKTFFFLLLIRLSVGTSNIDSDKVNLLWTKPQHARSCTWSSRPRWFRSAVVVVWPLSFSFCGARGVLVWWGLHIGDTQYICDSAPAEKVSSIWVKSRKKMIIWVNTKKGGKNGSSLYFFFFSFCKSIKYWKTKLFLAVSFKKSAVFISEANSFFPS